MWDRHPHGPRRDLRVGEHPVDGVDRPARHAGGLEGGDPGVHRPRAGDVVQQRDQRFAVADAAGVGGEACVLGELRPPGHRAEFAELAVIADRQGDMPVARREHAVGHDVVMLVARARRHHPADQIIHGLVGEPRHLGVEQREVDVLAAARPRATRQRGEDGRRRVHAGHQVGGGDAHLLRAAARQVVALAGDAHEAARALGDQVVAGARGVRPGLAEARDRAIDQARIDRARRSVVEAVFREAADLVVLDQDVGAAGEPADEALAGRGRQVEGDRALRPVGREEIGGVGRLRACRVAQEGRPPGTGVVAAARALDLDHVGAEIGQQLRGPRPGQDAAQIEHLEAGQGAAPRPRHGDPLGHDPPGLRGGPDEMPRLPLDQAGARLPVDRERRRPGGGLRGLAGHQRRQIELRIE